MGGMEVVAPVEVVLPASGLKFVESVHAPDFAMPVRTDAFHKLLLLVSGEVQYVRPGARTVGVGAGELLVVPAGQRHRLADLKAPTVMLMCFSQAWLIRQADLDGVWRALGQQRDPVLRFASPQRVRLETLWRRSLFEQVHARPGGAALLDAAAIEIVALAGRAPAMGPRETAQGRIDALVREIEHGFFEPWSIDRAARRTGMSRRSFSAHFKARCGTTFRDYVAAVRLAHAAQILGDGTHSVLGTMFSCGFNDVSNFYRLFKAKYGAPPVEWVKTRKRGLR